MKAAIRWLLLAGASSASAALQVDFTSPSSIKAAAKDVAFDLMSYYKGNQSGEVLGVLDPEAIKWSFWWADSAILWSTMIDYWRYTGDDTYNAVTVEALTAQNGLDAPDGVPFLPLNWTLYAQNSDHGFWGLASMQAAELGFPAAPSGQPGWFELAQGVFDVMAARWRVAEAGSCKGGLRAAILKDRAIDPDRMDSLSGAVFLNLGARLARFTGNQTYADWADKTWSWLVASHLIAENGTIYSSTNTRTNCSRATPETALPVVPAVLIEAAAYMANLTQPPSSTTWHVRLLTLTNRTLTSPAFHNLTLTEPLCEKATATCGPLAIYKGILLRSLAGAAQLAPSLLREAPLLADALRTTASAAAQRCVGGIRDRECAFRWGAGGDEKRVDGEKGVRAEMASLSAIVVMLRGEEGTRGVGRNGTVEVVGGGGGGGAGGEDGKEGEESGGAVVRVGMGLMLATVIAAVV